MTCLCVTRNRRNWLPKAIECFRLQTYATKELLIVADGQDVRDLVPADESIRLIHIAGDLRIGEKRNFGCSRARGEIIAHWDDDDYSDPARLWDQIHRLQNSGKAVTGYCQMRFVTTPHPEISSDAQWWEYSNDTNYAIGTSLCYRREWWESHQFPAKQVAEDEDFKEVALRAGQLIAAKAGDLMYATNHAGNTSPRSLRQGSWRPIL